MKNHVSPNLVGKPNLLNGGGGLGTQGLAATGRPLGGGGAAPRPGGRIR